MTGFEWEQPAGWAEAEAYEAAEKTRYLSALRDVAMQHLRYHWINELQSMVCDCGIQIRGDTGDALRAAQDAHQLQMMQEAT